MSTRPIVLVGFMASGKTTVGGHLAQRLSLPFVDVDAVIEKSAGKPIADIFATEGEGGFRSRERQALDEVLSQGPAVVATGGGAPCQPGAIETLRARGRVVTLHSTVDDAFERGGDASTRPLLAQPRDQLEDLYRSRQTHYRQAHLAVDTAAGSALQVSDQVVSGLSALDAVPESALASSSVVALGDRSYPVIVQPGVLSSVGAILRYRLGEVAGKAAVVSDENVAPHYLEPVRASLERAGFDVVDCVVPAGEPSKQLLVAGDVAEALSRAGLDRDSVVVALGGGVVGDLAGFVAATLFRGVAVAQVPTTLLAMTDSAIGGKTGVDLPAGKNLMGAFWQPTAVLTDTHTLATLPARERRAAIGEMFKYGLLDGEELYELCHRVGPQVCDGTADPAEQAELVRRCAAYKSWTVSLDERETSGLRAMLNLGHTVGHAIETAAGYGSLLHGECVALGLIAACRVSASLDLCDAALELRVTDSLRRCGLDTDLDPWLRTEVLDHMRVDKKRAGSRVRFITLGAVGVPGIQLIELDDLITGLVGSV